jgi:peptidoglycan/LPS O-acetylase OafA/YrhL
MAFGDRKKKKYSEFVETVSGEVVYVGKYYVYKADNPLPYRRLRIAIALACTGSAILAAADGLYRAPGTDRTLYVALPYVMMLCFTALFCYRGGKVIRAGNPMKAFDYRNSYGPMQHWALASAVFAVILIVCYFLHLARHGTQGCPMAAVVCYPLLAALIPVMDLWLLHVIRKNPWREAEGPEEPQ